MNRLFILASVLSLSVWAKAPAAGDPAAAGATTATTPATEAVAADVPVKLSIADFVKLPSTRSVQISPDGLHLAVVFRKNDEDVLAIVNIDTLTHVTGLKVKGVGRSVGQVYWVSDQRVIYTITESDSWDKEVKSYGEIHAANIDGSMHMNIFSQDHDVSGSFRASKAIKGSVDIVDLLADDPNHILIAFYPWRIKGKYWVRSDTRLPEIYQLNVYTGKKDKVAELASVGARGITDHQGQVRFSISEDDNNNAVMAYKLTSESAWQPFEVPDLADVNPYPISFGPKGESLYVLADVEQGTAALYQVFFKDKRVVKLSHDPKVDINQWLTNFSGEQIIGVGTDLGLTQYQFFDQNEPTTLLWQSLLTTFAGSAINITSHSKDQTKMIVQVFADNNPGDFYLYDRKAKQVRYLLSNRDWIYPEQLVKSESIVVKARDGLVLHGYLTKPKGIAKNLPMVVLPHGGPHGVRDEWGFDWEVQLLANQGYAVLQVNYRGSGGFGAAFETMGFGHWGTTMQDDITDATLAMVSQGIADKQRICLFGASYGGYAALMGAVREPQLYRCVIGSAGIYDLPMMYKEGDISERRSGLNYLKDVLGEDLTDLKQRSPSHHADKMSAAVLLIHGARDERAPIEQVEAMKAALTKADKPFQYMELSNEAHGYYDEANRLKIYQKVIDFLYQQIGQGVEP